MGAKDFVIVGSGLAGLPIAHHVLRFTAPKVPDLRVILITPETEAYLNLASPRAIVSEDFGAKVFAPLAPAFAKYGDRVELVTGKAEALDPAAKTVQVALNDGSRRTISYHTLLVASGSAARGDMPWKSLGETERTKKALQDLRARIAAAKSVVVAGGGPSGIEIAGELGQMSAKGDKEVTFVYDDRLPFPTYIKEGPRQTAADMLAKLKVKLVPGHKVSGAVQQADGRTALELTAVKGGAKQTVVADVYLPAFGTVANSSWLPREFLGADGRVKQTAQLRVEGHDDIFVAGDVGNIEGMRALGTEAQVAWLGKALGRYFTGQAAGPDYKPSTGVMMMTSIGPNGGTGQMMGMRAFNFLVAKFKAKNLSTDIFPDIVAGQRTIMGPLKA